MSEKVIFYIVVAAAWGLYNLFIKGKAKTKAGNSQAQPKVEPQATNVDELFAKLFDNTKTKTEPQIKPFTAEDDSKPRFTYDSKETSEAKNFNFDAGKYYEELKKQENELAEQNNRSLEAQSMSENEQTMAAPVEVIDETTENVNTNHWLSADAEDLRKAIVWNEILERPAWAN